MALNETVTNILLDARRHADAETPSSTTDFTPDAELLRYLNAAYRRFIDIVASSGDGAISLLLKSSVTASPYTIPADFYRVVALDMTNAMGDTPWRRVKPFTFSERNRYTDPNFPRYRIENNVIVLEPATAAPQQLQLWYVGNAGTLGSSDSINTINGWDDYLAWDVALQIMAKDERDPSVAMQMRAEARDRIEQACADLEAVDTHVISLVERQAEEMFDLWWP